MRAAQTGRGEVAARRAAAEICSGDLRYDSEIGICDATHANPEQGKSARRCGRPKREGAKLRRAALRPKSAQVICGTIRRSEFATRPTLIRSKANLRVDAGGPNGKGRSCGAPRCGRNLLR